MGRSTYTPNPSERRTPPPRTTWQELGSYSQTATLPPVLNAAGTAPDPRAENESWLVTLGFLLGLIVAGFVAGYLLRGNGQASAANTVETLTIATLADDAPTAFLPDDGAELVSTFGSERSDELVQLTSNEDGSMLALVRVHMNTPNTPDQLQMLRIASDSTVSSAGLLKDTSDTQAGVALGVDGTIFVATRGEDYLRISTESTNQDKSWLRDLPAFKAHQAGLHLLPVETGLLVIGPSESADRITLAHFDPVGVMTWQRSFAADAARPDIAVSTGDNGLYLAVRSAESDFVPMADLRHVSFDGQVSWEESMPLGSEGAITELLAVEDGVVVLMSAANMPFITKYNRDGSGLWGTALLRDTAAADIKLIPDTTAGVLVAEYTREPTPELILSRYDDLGLLDRETRLALPTSGDVNIMQTVETGKLRVAGSVLPSRYDDTDVFIADFTVDPATWPDPDWETWRALPETEETAVSDTFAETPSEVVEIAAYAPVETVEPASRETRAALDARPVATTVVPSEAAPAETVPALVTQDARENAFTRDTDQPVAEIVMLGGQASSELTTALEGLSENAFATGPRVSVVALPDTVDPLSAMSEALNAERASQAIVEITGTQTAQCRFTCLEAGGTGVSFPMWTSVLVGDPSFGAEIGGQHKAVCEAAGGAIDARSTPSCQINR